MKYLVILTLLVSLVGCEKDPYPGEGSFIKNPRKPTVVKDPPIGFQVAEKVDFSEGRENIVKIRINVPKPGKPIVWVEDLPKGAVFVEKDLMIKWIPGFYDGNNLKDPTIKSKDYFVKINYKSTEDEPNSHHTAKVMFVVYDVPRDFKINTAKVKSVNEGGTLHYDFTVNSVDYPKGPFKVYTEGMPANTTVKKLSDTEYRLVFSPDFLHVKLNNNPNPCNGSNKNCMKYTPTITVNNPANHETKTQVTIKVNDVRQPIKLVTPDNMQQGLDISFGIASVDPNGEIAPNISVVDGKPRTGYGDFSTNIKQDEVNNSSVFSVSWKDIPLVMNGKSHTFKFKTCVMSDCDTKSFTVNIVVKDRNAPTFLRENWKQGEIKYLKHNESFATYIGIKDADSAMGIENVKVVPEHMKKFVKFNTSNSKIEVQFSKPGFHQFSLVATSPYNVSSAESFVVEVFRKDRHKTIYFTDSTRNEEARFYKEVMGDVQLLNPVLNVLHDRILAGRDNLILGTDILQDPAMQKDIARAMSKIGNVVVASSLLENMPPKFLDELQNDFRVSILGRYSDISGAPDLKKMYFVARDDFQKPSAKIRLKLKSTSESFDPLVFSIGVDRKNCQDVMDFTNKGEVHGSSLFKIGIICDRKNKKGRVAILGTEFSDLKAVKADEKVPAFWLKKMLSTSLNNKKVK